MSCEGFTRDDYLKNEDVAGFVDYFVGVLDGKIDFKHSYVVRFRRWTKDCGLEGDRTLSFSSFKCAAEKYYWPASYSSSMGEDEGGQSGARNSHDFAANERVLSALQGNLKDALEDGEDRGTFVAALKILDWGQVYRGSVTWLIKSYERDTLVRDIKRARDILDGDESECLSEFDGCLQIDSGLTKVFSLASQGSIIYDDRVAAALGLLVRRYLLKVRKSAVPTPLQFVRSMASGRNPSEGLYTFPTKRSGKTLATSNLMANWILRGVRERTQISHWDSLRKIEAALFMIGYRV